MAQEVENVLVVLIGGFYFQVMVPSCAHCPITYKPSGFQISSWCVEEKDQLLGADKTEFLSLWNYRRNPKLGPGENKMLPWEVSGKTESGPAFPSRCVVFALQMQV